MRPPDEIRAEISKLRSMRDSGVQNYKHGEREVTLVGRAAFDAAISALQAELDQTLTGAAAVTPPAFSRIRSRGRGL